MSGTLKIGSKTLVTHDTSSNQINLHSDITATHSQVFGNSKTFSGAHAEGATTINLNNVTGISVGDVVIAEGVLEDTTVTSIGTSSVVISNALETGDANNNVAIVGGEPITFYTPSKALSPALTAGSLCRVWVNFNGNIANYAYENIRASKGVSSIYQSGTGDYTVNFTNSMIDGKYCVTLSAGRTQDTTNAMRVGVIKGPPNANYVRIATCYSDNNTSNAQEVCVAIFR